MLMRADAVTALTADVEDAVRRLGILHVRLLPNPIPIRSEPFDLQSRNQVLFAGEIGRRKGVDVLLEAWRTVVAVCPETSLRLVGPIAEPDLLAQLPEGVVYGGVLDRDGVMDALDGSCLAVLPSRAEAMPMFILEAMAAGVPVVATPVGAVESVVGGAGRIVPAGRAEPLSTALIELLRDRSALSAMSESGRRRVTDEFSNSIFERRVLEMYAQIFEGGS